MVAGDPFNRSYDGSLAGQGISFNCLGAGQPETGGIPNYKCPGGLRAQVFFPQCWDGKNADSPDHKSHMSYPAGNVYNGGNCPASHPVHMISMFFEIHYDTARFENEWPSDSQHPFVFAQGDATGFGMHGDFFNGWDVDVLQKAVDTCTDDSGQVEKCGAVTMFTNEECNSCKLPVMVNEAVDGDLAALPGCNPVSYGPERAKFETCSGAPAAIGSGSANYVDVTKTKGWEYLGCGTDKVTDRAFNGSWTYSANMTIENCIDYCTDLGFPYAAPENGNECFCNKELNPKYAPKEGIMGTCAKKCTGNDKQICGNANAMSIYHKCDSSSNCKNNEIGGTAPPAAKREVQTAKELSTMATVVRTVFAEATPPTYA